jgi:hypothetical protein
MRTFVGFVLSAALFVMIGAGAALAQPIEPARQAPAADQGDAAAVLARLRESVNFARYDEALASVRSFLARTDLSASQRNAALEALAIVQIATRAETDARATLEQLYRRDPQHRLSDADASPRVQSAFARARDAHPAVLPVRLEQAPLDLRQRESPLVAVRIAIGADAVEEVRLAYRVAGDRRFTRVVMAFEQGVARARIPVAGDPSRALAIDYFVEAVAPSLIPLGNLGSESEPLVAQVPAARLPSAVQVVAPPDLNTPTNGWAAEDGSGAPVAPVDEGTSITSTWWFWTLLAVVVVGGAVGTYFAVTSGGEAPVGTLGTITLN